MLCNVKMYHHSKNLTEWAQGEEELERKKYIFLGLKNLLTRWGFQCRDILRCLIKDPDRAQVGYTEIRGRCLDR